MRRDDNQYIVREDISLYPYEEGTRERCCVLGRCDHCDDVSDEDTGWYRKKFRLGESREMEVAEGPNV